MSLSAVFFPCDCHEIQTLDLTQLTGLSLHSASAHLSRKLALALAAHELALERRGGAWFVVAADFGCLDTVLALFSATERPELLAAPWMLGELAPWQLAPLETWVQRLGSPWFAAASAQGLHFHLQPIVELASGRVYGYEALVRAHGAEGLIGAGLLLEAAAAHGQARAFDALARRSAIGQVYPQLQPGEMLAINFAPGVVYNPDICLRTTFEACQEVGADVSRLLFEVTESEAFPDLELLRSILQRYRAEGAQVALDDLGAGRTSLTYLFELRPDIVKLDRALVRGLHGADPRVPLVASLIRYAQDLGIRVVSEGIETAGELELVRQLGSDYAQGYFLGRPAPQPAGVAEAAARMWPGQAPARCLSL